MLVVREVIHSIVLGFNPLECRPTRGQDQRDETFIMDDGFGFCGAVKIIGGSELVLHNIDVSCC